jgi:hypothetical protein
MTSETTPVSQQPTVNPTPLPWLGVAAIVISAMAATLTGRLNSAGLADVRGGLGVGVDEGAWIITAFSAAQMMIGPIAVWLGFVFTPRRVLLAGCTLFGLAELLLPLAPNLGLFLVLEACAGVGSGVFIPLVGGFIFVNLPQRYWPIAIAGYVMNVVLGLNIASALEGWYSEYASWRWIFWQNAILAAPLFASFWFGMPRVPLNRAISWRGDWLGMMLGVSSLAFAFAALDQGDRLDWSNSNLVVSGAQLRPLIAPKCLIDGRDFGHVPIHHHGEQLASLQLSDIRQRVAPTGDWRSAIVDRATAILGCPTGGESPWKDRSKACNSLWHDRSGLRLRVRFAAHFGLGRRRLYIAARGSGICPDPEPHCAGFVSWQEHHAT